MDAEPRRVEPALRVIETVRCLECRTVYSRLKEWKSAVGPGCPDCGYVGWQPFSSDSEPLLHLAGDLRRTPRVQLR